jgi:hypothetical protein
MGLEISEDVLVEKQGIEIKLEWFSTDSRMKSERRLVIQVQKISKKWKSQGD